MPALKNPKHELFAQRRAEGHTADEAYKLAGFKPDRGHASRLATNGSIVERVIELQAGAVERTTVTIESLIDEAAQNQRIALAMGQIGAANGALKLKAVFAGLYVEKTDNTNTNINVDPNDISDEEIAAVLKAGGDDRPASQANGSSKPH